MSLKLKKLYIFKFGQTTSKGLIKNSKALSFVEP